MASILETAWGNTETPISLCRKYFCEAFQKGLIRHLNVDSMISALCDPFQLVEYQCRGREEENLTAILTSDSIVIQDDLKHDHECNAALEPRMLAALQTTPDGNHPKCQWKRLRPP